MASTFNLPMISHYFSHGATSDKRLYKTFARTRPPATVVTKSLVSLLLKYKWTTIAFFRPMSSKLNSDVSVGSKVDILSGNRSKLTTLSDKKDTPGDYEDIAISMKAMFKESQIRVKCVITWLPLVRISSA